MSSNEQINIQPESLQQTSQQLRVLAQQMAADTQHLQAAVTSNNPWGHDESGTLFADIYTTVLNHTLNALTSYVQQTEYGAEALAMNAQDAVDTDTSSAHRIVATTQPPPTRPATGTSQAPPKSGSASSQRLIELPL